MPILERASIYWPRNVNYGLRDGFLIGWEHLKTKTFCVASVLFAIELKELAECLKMLLEEQDDSIVRQISKTCSGKPKILGCLNPTGRLESIIPEITALEGEFCIIISYDSSTDSYPKLDSIQSKTGCLLKPANVSFITYTPPDSYFLQSYKTSPLILDTTVNDSHFTSVDYSFDDPNPRPAPWSANIKMKLSMHVRHRDMMDPLFEPIISDLNMSHDLDYAVRKRLNQGHVNVPNIRRFVGTEILVLPQSVKNLIYWPVVYAVIAIRYLAEVILILLDFSIQLSTGNQKTLSFAETSCFAQQVVLRLEQFCFWPWQYLVFTRPSWRYSYFNRSQYISFFNSVWLVANDMIIGYALGSYLINYSEALAKMLRNAHQEFTVELIRNSIVWLMGWPAGLKLNSNLDSFLGELFMWLISIWSFVVEPVWSFLPLIICTAGYLSLMGATVSIALFYDLFTLMTFHLSMFHNIAMKMYHGQFSALLSLFNLFRGKKYNVLRNRVDSCDYGLDQLLLGTILFTVLFFLFPTVSVYYILFCLARIGVISVQIAIRSLLVALNHFPLFALMLRVKDPFRLPGRIYMNDIASLNVSIEYEDETDPDVVVTPVKLLRMQQLFDMTPTSCRYDYYSLENKPIGLGQIFFQYSLLFRELVSRYASFSVLTALVTGQPLPSVTYLEYPMLPERRATIEQYWSFLVKQPVQAKETVL